MSLIDSFLTAVLEVTRNDATGSYVDGRYVPGASSQVLVKAVVMNATPKEILLLPKGRQSKNTLKIYSDVELVTNNESSQTQADTFIYLGQAFQVISINNWAQNTDLPHYESMAQLVDPQGDA